MTLSRAQNLDTTAVDLNLSTKNAVQKSLSCVPGQLLCISMALFKIKLLSRALETKCPADFMEFFRLTFEPRAVGFDTLDRFAKHKIFMYSIYILSYCLSNQFFLQ